MRRANLALFLITVAIVLSSLLRSVLSGPSGSTQSLARRSSAGRAPQAAVAELNRRASIDCALGLDGIGFTAPATHVGGSNLPGKASTLPASAQPGSHKKKL